MNDHGLLFDNKSLKLIVVSSNVMLGLGPSSCPAISGNNASIARLIPSTVTFVGGPTIGGMDGIVSLEGITVSSEGITVSFEGTTVSSDVITVSSDGITVSSDGTTVSFEGITASSEGITVSFDGTTVSFEGTIVSSDGIVSF